MSKHVLNTIILMVLLIIILVGGLFYIHEKYGKKINDIQSGYRDEKEEYQRLQNFKVEVDQKNEELRELKYQLNNFPTMTIDKKYIHQVLLYFEEFDPNGEFFQFDYSVNSIKSRDEVTEATYSLSGNGNFKEIESFINYLEYSPPLFFIQNFSFSSQKNGQGTIKLLIRGVFLEKSEKSDRDIFSISPKIHYSKEYNPFEPLITQNLPPNTLNLPDIRNAKLISLVAPETAWFKFGDGQLKSFEVGGRVYLGEMTSIDVEEGIAVFKLNMGGIKKVLEKKLNEKVSDVQ
ncbi:MAG: hypothetical protein K9N00_02265 [Candidatus Marinimicrobia bacterium]|nr:hypothetical protein [Candidatus Neomarinimicrobiota bacterium]